MARQIGSSLTALMVSDKKRSMQYYREVLGFNVTDWWAERDGLQGLALKLLQAPPGFAVNPNPPEIEGGRAYDVYAYVENWVALDSLYQEFVGKGAFISGEPIIDPQGGPWKEFIVRDPDGYNLAFGGVDGRKSGCYIQDHIDSVFLRVRDLDRSVRMYSQLLGLKLVEEERLDRMHVFKLPNGTSLILDSNDTQVIPRSETGRVLFKLSTVDIEGASKHARELGFEMGIGIVRSPTMSCFNILDGDGNMITIAQNHE